MGKRRNLWNSGAGFSFSLWGGRQKDRPFWAHSRHASASASFAGCRSVSWELNDNLFPAASLQLAARQVHHFSVLPNRRRNSREFVLFECLGHCFFKCSDCFGVKRINAFCSVFPHFSSANFKIFSYRSGSKILNSPDFSSAIGCGTPPALSNNTQESRTCR